MYRLSKPKMDRVNQFLACALTDITTAINCLSIHGWRVDAAVENFYKDPRSYCQLYLYPRPSFDMRGVQAMWRRYVARGGEHKMLVEGVSQFLADLQLDPRSRTALILAWKFNAQTHSEFTLEEFLSGMLGLGCDSIDKLRTRCSSLEYDIQDPRYFENLYHFTFNYAKSPGQKGLDQETAVAYWNLLLAGRFKFYDLWCEFLQENPEGSISKEVWHDFLEFCNMINDDMSNYDATEAWPELIDDFVAYAKPIVRGSCKSKRRSCLP